MWRLVYSKYKLSDAERCSLEQAVEDYTHTCGAQLKDLGGSFEKERICMRNICCYEPLEKLYYSVGTYKPLCIFCCSNEELTTKDGRYPQCKTCSSREPIKKRK